MGVKGIKELKEFKSKMERLEKKEINEFYQYIARQVAMRFLGYVIPDTPVQSNHTIVTPYKTYKVIGGALRRGWIGKEGAGSTPNAAEIRDYANKLTLTGTKTKSITISNNVEYAPYVEYGHRQRPGRYVPVLGKRLVEAWVPGQFMLKRAVKNIQSEANGLIRKLATQWMRNYFE